MTANADMTPTVGEGRHLPECLLPDFDKGAWVCICDRLRACEQRVLRDAVNSDAVRGAIRIAEQRALDAAREAVAAVRPWNLGVVKIDRDDALAAIDALRGDA